MMRWPFQLQVVAAEVMVMPRSCDARQDAVAVRGRVGFAGTRGKHWTPPGERAVHPGTRTFRALPPGMLVAPPVPPPGGGRALHCWQRCGLPVWPACAGACTPSPAPAPSSPWWPCPRAPHRSCRTCRCSTGRARSSWSARGGTGACRRCGGQGSSSSPSLNPAPRSAPVPAPRAACPHTALGCPPPLPAARHQVPHPPHGDVHACTIPRACAAASRRPSAGHRGGRGGGGEGELRRPHLAGVNVSHDTNVAVHAQVHLAAGIHGRCKTAHNNDKCKERARIACPIQPGPLGVPALGCMAIDARCQPPHSHPAPRHGQPGHPAPHAAA